MLTHEDRIQTDDLRHDRHILRELCQRKFDIGSLAIQAHTAEAWRRLNELDPVRPMVWINEIPWHELNVDGCLEPRCRDPFLRGIESHLLRELYQWDHFRCDMVVEPVIDAPLVGGPTSSYADYGIEEKLDRAEGGKDVGFIPVIHSEADADRITTPRVWFDRERTERQHRLLVEVFEGVIPVRRRGIVHQWHSPWDQIIHWYGIEQLYTDMYDRPQLVHRILGNFMRALHEVVDQQQALGMLDVSNGNHRVGSGGMGITSELPAHLPPGEPVTTAHQWGCATAQIFWEVSPDMHEEFARQDDRPLMHRYGLTYYGCCEPLDRKVDMLRSVRNLRKISMSPWTDPARASEALGRDYVMSYKPTPAALAMGGFDAQQVRADLKRVLDLTRGNCVELILKDISTVCDQPDRLDAWPDIAMQLVHHW
mgnify:CR=1 FL=1